MGIYKRKIYRKKERKHAYDQGKRKIQEKKEERRHDFDHEKIKEKKILTKKENKKERNKKEVKLPSDPVCPSLGRCVIRLVGVS